MSGYYEVTGQMSANSFVSGLRGPNDVVFKDGQHIRFGFPSYKLGGTVMGERTIEAIGSCTYEDLTNHRKAVLLMNTYEKVGMFKTSHVGCKDQMVGQIYDCKKPLTGDRESIKVNYSRDIKFVDKLKDLKDVKKKICEMEGSWLNNLVIGGKEFWNADRDTPPR